MKKVPKFPDNNNRRAAMPALLIIGEPLSYVLWLWPRDMTDGDVVVQFVRVIS